MSTGSDSRHPIFARVWPRIAGKVAAARHRAELLGGLGGRVVEVGAGEGRNFAHYPTGVSEVIAVEPEPHLRGLAVRAAAAASVPVTVLGGVAEALALEAASFDGAVSSLVLCSVSDQHAALGELRRVLVPGGELRFFEHVLAHRRVGAALQRALDRSGVWPTLGGGCHLARDTVGAIEASGFTVERVRRFSPGLAQLGIPFVLGTARRRD